MVAVSPQCQPGCVCASFVSMEMLEISCSAQFLSSAQPVPPRSPGLRPYLVWGHNPHQWQGQLLQGMGLEQDPSFSFISPDTGARVWQKGKKQHPVTGLPLPFEHNPSSVAFFLSLWFEYLSSYFLKPSCSEINALNHSNRRWEPRASELR